MLTSKQRAYLRGLANREDAVVSIGKESLTAENTMSIDEALAARELVKVAVLKNCDGDIPEIAETAAGRTRSEVVQVIGRKFVLYRPGKDKKKKITLPPAH